MAALTRDYEMSKDNYKSLLDKKLAAGMATNMEKRQQGERFTMLDPPRVPEKPVSPKRPLLIGIGCAISLALALAFPIARRPRRTRCWANGSCPKEWLCWGGCPISSLAPVRSRNPQEEMGQSSRRSRSWEPAWPVSIFIGDCGKCTNPSSDYRKIRSA